MRCRDEVDQEIDLGREHQRREDHGEHEPLPAKPVAGERVRRQ